MIRQPSKASSAMMTEFHPDESSPRRSKPRVYQEDAKTRQTSHWDWDYLPLKTIERLVRERREVPPEAESPQDPQAQKRIALVCIAAGALLLVGLLAVYAYVGQAAV